jgi:hypothetical protein
VPGDRHAMKSELAEKRQQHLADQLILGNAGEIGH